VTLLCISVGLSMGWTSPYLALLTGDDAPFPITQEQGSWIASLLPLGRLFGAIIGALFVEYLGNKIALFITGLPLIVGWVCVMAADSIAWLYIFRVFAGNSVDPSSSHPTRKISHNGARDICRFILELLVSCTPYRTNQDCQWECCSPVIRFSSARFRSQRFVEAW